MNRAKEAADLKKNDSIKTKTGNAVEGPDAAALAGRYGIAQGRAVLALIRHARRRLFYNALLAQGANTASAALLAFIFCCCWERRCWTGNGCS